MNKNEKEKEIKMKKVLSLSKYSLPKDQMDKLVNAVCQEEGKERLLEWSLHDDGRLDLYAEYVKE